MFAIAEAIGGRTVTELEAVMPASEMWEWLEWFSIKDKAERDAIARAKNK